MHKVLFFVIDGLADLPINGKTPLSEANKPNIDLLAGDGRVGTLTVLSRERWKKLSKISSASISHFANISLLGYNPEKFKELRRGPLEAVGANIPYVEGHLAVRCNFATVDENLNLIDRRAGRNSFGLDELARYINKNVKIGVKFTFMRTFEHRAVLILQKRLSDKISTNDPFEMGKRVKKIKGRWNGKETAKLVQEFVDKAHSLMRFHLVNEERVKRKLLPANYLLVREAGNKLLALPSFSNRWKVKPVCVAENGVVKATCLLAGFTSVTVPELSFKKTLDFIFKSIENCLPEYDLIYAHIKEPDKYAHDGDFEGKRKCIEEIDERFEDLEDFKGAIVITCDHLTACKTGRHEQGRVPLLVHGRGKDKVKKFDEFSAKRGSLRNFTPAKLWKLVFKG